jgi:hypothetical protein
MRVARSEGGELKGQGPASREPLDELAPLDDPAADPDELLEAVPVEFAEEEAADEPERPDDAAELGVEAELPDVEDEVETEAEPELIEPDGLFVPQAVSARLKRRQSGRQRAAEVAIGRCYLLDQGMTRIAFSGHAVTQRMHAVQAASLRA